MGVKHGLVYNWPNILPVREAHVLTHVNMSKVHRKQLVDKHGGQAKQW